MSMKWAVAIAAESEQRAKNATNVAMLFGFLVAQSGWVDIMAGRPVEKCLGRGLCY